MTRVAATLLGILSWACAGPTVGTESASVSQVATPVATPAATSAAAPPDYLADLCDDLRVKWPKNRTINVVCHGHSVPAGYFKTPVVDTFNAYPHLLHQALKQRFPHAVINVIVTAIGGENSVSGAARFQADVLTHRPDLITIDYALNDRRAGLEASRESLTAMLDQARAAGVPVLMLTPTLDQRAKLEDEGDPLNQHAVQVRELARVHGVGLVDSLAASRAEIAGGAALGDLMSQVNHPNRRGHELVVAALMEWFPEAR